MWMARHGRTARQQRRHQRHSVLQRRHDFHSAEAVCAALQGSLDKAAGHSGLALLISRELYMNAADPAAHQAGLAAALNAHAGYGGGGLRAVRLLTESAGHYAELAEADPARYEVRRIEVLARIALTAGAAGAAQDAIGLLREVVGMYQKASAADPDERDLGLARARFQLGRCLLRAGHSAEGLGETEAGLELAADVLDRLGLPGACPDWLVKAPRYVQLAAPDWAAAACQAMTRHAAAGRLEQAATAARTAIEVSDALTAFGGDMLRDARDKIRARAGQFIEGSGCLPDEAKARSV
jgi:tetratricopeptide (TPR) repeat protein